MILRIIRQFNQYRVLVLKNSLKLWKNILTDFKESDLKSGWHVDNAQVHELECKQG